MYIPFISRTFPAPPHGRYATGYATVRLPAAVPYAHPLPFRTDGTPALQLTGSVVAVYYPTNVTPSSSWNLLAKARVPWLPDNQAAVLEGYNKFLQGRFGRFGWWIVGKFLARAKMPLHSLAPLAPPPIDKPYPLVLFSHGLAGTRNTYSQFCSALASEGYVVIAVEHADGSGPAVIRAGREQTFLKFMETVWPGKTNVMPVDVPKTKMTDEHVVMMDMRAQQLDFRVHEIYDAYTAFTGMLRGSTNATVDNISSPASFISALREAVDPTNLFLTGHSFGGGTVLRLLTTATPTGYIPLPAKRAVLLDPWVEPSQVAKGLPEVTTPAPPTLVINSERWTEDAVFPLEFKLCREVAASVVTIMGLGHQGFSDFALLTSNNTARAYLTTIHDLTMGALTDSLLDVPAMQAPADHGNVTLKNGKLLGGKKGDVLVHAKAKSD